MTSGPADPKSSQAQPSWVVGPPVPPASRLGQLIDGEFLIKGILGQGELGVTYEADNTRLKRRFALLMLSRELKPTHGMMLAVRDDLRRAQPLTAAGLMPVKLIADRDGIPGFATELLDGETLRSRLGRGPLRVERAIALILSVAHTLEASHKVGLIHGDLRPENIFLVRPGAKSAFAGKAMLVEHALHHLRRRQPGLDDRLPLYKLMYRPPELVLGEAAVSEQSDVWVLGAIFYECLTGKPAFYAEEPEFVLDNLGNPPRPLAANSAIGLSAEMCAAFNVLVASACTRELESRIPNMSELIEGLEQLAAGSALKLPENVVESSEEAAAVQQAAAAPNRRMNRLLQRLSGVFPQIQLPGAANQPPAAETPAGAASGGGAAAGRPAVEGPLSLPKIQQPLQPIVPPKERVSRILQRLSGTFPTIAPPGEGDDGIRPGPGEAQAAPVPQPAAAAPGDLPTPRPNEKMSDLERALEILRRQRAEAGALHSVAEPPPAAPDTPPVAPPVAAIQVQAAEVPPQMTPARAAPSLEQKSQPQGERPTQPPIELEPSARRLAARDEQTPEPASSQLPLTAAPPAKPAAPSASSAPPVKPAEPFASSATPVKPSAPAASSATPVKPAAPSASSAPPIKPSAPAASSATSAKPAMPSASSAPPVKPAVPSASSAPLLKSAEPLASSVTPANPAAPSASSAPPLKPTAPSVSSTPPAVKQADSFESSPAPVPKPLEPSTKSPPRAAAPELPAAAHSTAEPPAKSAPPAHSPPAPSATTPKMPGLSPAEASTLKPGDAAFSSAVTPRVGPRPSAVLKLSSPAYDATLHAEDLAEVSESSTPPVPVPSLAAKAPEQPEAGLPSLPALKSLSDLPTRPAVAALIEKLEPVPGITEQATQPALRRMPITTMETQAKVDMLPSELAIALAADVPPPPASAPGLPPPPVPMSDSGLALTPPAGVEAPLPPVADKPRPPPPAADKPRPPRPPRVSQLIAAIQAQQPPPAEPPPMPAPRGRVSPGLIAPAPDLLAAPPAGQPAPSSSNDAVLRASGPVTPMSWVMRHQEAVAALVGATLVILFALLYLLLRG